MKQSSSPSFMALVMDVDGVLTDGSITIADNGYESRSYCARDGFGIKRLHEAGIRTAFLTGGNSDGVRRRATMLGIASIRMGVSNKEAGLKALCAELELVPGQIAYIGDDLLDLPAMCMAGGALTVPEAPAEVRSCADLVTAARGGHGAVREVCELLLRGWQPQKNG